MKIFLLIYSVFGIILAVTSYKADTWGITKTNATKTLFQWTITNFSSSDIVIGSYYSSPLFISLDKRQKWIISLYPNGYDSNYKNYISVILQFNGDKQINTRFKFALVTDNQDLFYVGKPSEIIFNPREYNYLLKFISREQFLSNKFLIDDNLTILLEIIEYHGFKNYDGNCLATEPSASRYLHLDKFEKLLEEELFSDLKLLVGSYEFPVHKAILSSFSTVFLNRLKKNLSESVIELKNENAIIFKEVLQFIYTGKIDNIDNIAKDLLITANKYEIKSLIPLCEEALCRSMSADNAIDIMTIADDYDLKNLQTKASKYIQANPYKVSESRSFKTMEALNPHPIFKIFRSMTSNNGN